MLLLAMFVAFLPLAPAQAQAPDPELLGRYSEVGQRALAERRYPEAEQAYEKLRELSPQTAEVHAGLGLIYYQQRKFAPAVPACPKSSRSTPPTQRRPDIVWSKATPRPKLRRGAGSIVTSKSACALSPVGLSQSPRYRSSLPNRRSALLTEFRSIGVRGMSARLRRIASRSRTSLAAIRA